MCEVESSSKGGRSEYRITTSSMYLRNEYTLIGRTSTSYQGRSSYD